MADLINALAALSPWQGLLVGTFVLAWTALAYGAGWGVRDSKAASDELAAETARLAEQYRAGQRQPPRISEAPANPIPEPSRRFADETLRKIQVQF